MHVRIESSEQWSAEARAGAWPSLRRATATAPKTGLLLGFAEVWRKLTMGDYAVLDTLYADDHCVSTLRREPRPHPLKQERVEILRRVLLGESLKSVALDSGIVMWTSARACRQCLRATGCGDLQCRASLLLVMAAHATRGFRIPDASISSTTTALGKGLVLRYERPDTALAQRLTPSEYDVARLLVEGNSHVKIATLRKSSPRTVANHLSSIFRKLGVSGRGELLARLIREQWTNERA